MNCIVSTIGTSLITNGTSIEDRKFINSIANLNENEITSEEKNRLDNLISIAKNKLLSQDLSYIPKISAELNGIISFYEMNLNNRKSDIHILIATDTFESKRTADLVKGFLEQYSFTVIIERIEGLSTIDSDSFENGVKRLISKLYEIIQGYKKSNYKVIFNLTAGFKITQAYMNILGMFLADEIDYLFETGKLIKIPKLPIKFTNETLLKKYSAEFSMMEKHQTLQKDKISSKYFEEVSRIFYDKIEDNGICYISLSAWGILSWKEVCDKIFGEKLIDFPNFQYEQLFITNFNKTKEKIHLIKLQKKLAEISQQLMENKNILTLVQSKGIHYENYKNKNFGTTGLGHFRISDSLRVNCLFYKNKLYLLEFGEHSIEDNLSRYKNVIDNIINS